MGGEKKGEKKEKKKGLELLGLFVCWCKQVLGNK
jgi:hypothetical protein